MLLCSNANVQMLMHTTPQVGPSGEEQDSTAHTNANPQMLKTEVTFSLVS